MHQTTRNEDSFWTPKIVLAIKIAEKNIKDKV